MIVQSCVRRSSHVDGPTGLESEPAGVRSSPFCIAIGPVCIPGRLLFSANFSFSLDYWVQNLCISQLHVLQSLVLFNVLLRSLRVPLSLTSHTNTNWQDVSISVFFGAQTSVTNTARRSVVMYTELMNKDFIFILVGRLN